MEIFAMQGIWGKRSISKKNVTRARWLLWPTNFTLSLAFSFPAPRQLSGNFYDPLHFPVFSSAFLLFIHSSNSRCPSSDWSNAWILGSRNRANRSNSCWGTPSSRFLADAAACAVFFFCRSSVAAPFCRAAPCCLAACSFIDPDPWPAGGVADGSAVFPPVGGGRCPTHMPSAELEKAVNERGISSRTMRTAKSRIGDRLVTEKDGTAWVCYLRN